MEKKIKPMVDEKYQICTRCVMDTSDSDIVFDSNGICNHCTEALERQKKTLSPENKEQALKQIIADIKSAGKGKQYDCVVGVSGGVDSSYVAYLAKTWQLKPLCVHLDNFWNTEIAEKNIANICKAIGADLITVPVDK